MKTSKIITRRRSTYPIREVDSKLLTQQQFRTDCDINAIIKNAQRGIPPKFTQQGTPHYGDFTNIPNIESAYDLVLKAEEAFLALPSALRAELNNDPVNLNKLTHEQAKRYDLLKTVPAPQATPPSPAEPAPAATAPNPPKGGSKPSSNDAQ